MSHKFWETQPIYFDQNSYNYNSKITELNKSEDSIKLPNKFSFERIYLSDTHKCEKLCDFLNEHQIKNLDKREFIKQYSCEYLQSKYSNNVHLLLTIFNNENIVGCLLAHVSKMQINTNQIDTVIIDNIVTHINLRNKRMCVPLFKESVKHFSLLGYEVGFGMNNNKIINNFSKIKYLNRAINVKKLKETGYISYKESDSYKQIKKTHKMVNTVNKNFRLYKMEDLEIIFKLYQTYVERYNFYQIMTLSEFEHMMENKNIQCYVMTDDRDIPVDFIIYEKYNLISTNFLNEKSIWIKDISMSDLNSAYDTFNEFVKIGKLNINYTLDDFTQMVKNKTGLYNQFLSYYCVYKTTLPVVKGVVKYYSGHKNSLYKIMSNLVSVLQNKSNGEYKIDVLELPEIMDSESMLYELLFSETAKEDYYTLYNYNIAYLNPNQIAY